MSNILGKIEDDYDEYKEFCKEIGETPLSLTDKSVNFYNHLDLLLTEHGVISIGHYYQKYVK